MISVNIGNVEQFSEVKSYIYCPDFGDVGMMNPIETLPQELFLHICSFLKYYDVVSVGSTCRKLKKSIEDVALWRRIAKVELVNFEDTSIYVSSLRPPVKFNSLCIWRPTELVSSSFIIY